LYYRICPQRPGVYESRSAQDPALARVGHADAGQRPARAGFGLGETTPQVIEAEVLTHVVGTWVVPPETGPDEIADDAIRCFTKVDRA
jgi:hypothetical protein